MNFNRRRREIDTTATQDEYSMISQKKYLESDLMGSLPVNRTVFFSCNNPGNVQCLRFLVRINNFQVDRDNPIFAQTKFTVNLQEINQILSEDLEFFVIDTNIKAIKEKDYHG